MSSPSSHVAACALIVLLAACEADRTTTIEIPRPNAPAPAKEGQVELTKYADKVVVTNHSDRGFWDCEVLVDDTLRGELGVLAPRATATVMRTRFRPYTEANVFYARLKAKAVMECMSADQGLVRVQFANSGPEYTVPAEALGPPR